MMAMAHASWWLTVFPWVPPVLPWNISSWIWWPDFVGVVSWLIFKIGWARLSKCRLDGEINQIKSGSDIKIKVGLGMPSWTRLLICAQNCSDLMSPKEISFQDSPPFTMRAPSCDLTRWYSPRNPRKDSIPGSNWMTLQPRTGSGNAQSRDLKRGAHFFRVFFGVVFSFIFRFG